MKTTHLFGKVAALVAIGFLGLVTSCKDNEVATSQDVIDAGSESLTESYYQDADDVSLYSIDNVSLAGGRVAAGDYRVTCATIEKTGDKASGTVTINFGTGCTDSKGNIRKGKINLAYSGGPATTIGFKVTETFTDYYINGVKIEGTRVIERVEATGNNIKHDITLTGGKATWPDNTVATRAADFVREIIVNDGLISVTGGANGITRKGKSYVAEIASALIHKKTCMADGIYMAVKGIKVFVIDGKNISIDYGNGDCDKKVTVTINNVQKEVTLGRN